MITNQYDTNELLKRGNAMLSQNQTPGGINTPFSGSSFDTPEAQAMAKTDPVSLANFQKANPALSFNQKDMAAYQAAGVPTPAQNATITPPRAVSADAIGQNSYLSDLQSALKRNQDLQQKYIDAVNAPKPQEELDLETQLQNIRQKGLSLEANKQAGLDYTEDKIIPMEFITGQQVSIERRANTQLTTLAAQEKALVERLGVKQTERKGKLDAIKEAIGIGSQQVSDYSKLQSAIQAQQDSVLKIMQYSSEQAKNALATILKQFKGSDFESLNPNAQNQLAQLAIANGIPVQALIAGLATEKNTLDLENLQKAQKMKLDASSAGLDAAYKKSQIDKNYFDMANGGEKSKLLSVADAIALGVPYGTRQSQATGLTPKQPMTDTQYKSSGYAHRMTNDNETFDQLSTYVANLNPVAFATYRKADEAGGLANMIVPSKVQLQLQAERDFVNAKLRQESGAAISPSEFANAAKQYFPQPGDSAEVLAQKKKNRELVTRDMAAEAGSRYTGVQNPSGVAGSNTGGGADISDLNFRIGKK